mgnify:CR=1 FL=1
MQEAQENGECGVAVEFETGGPPTLVNTGMCEAMDGCLAQIECGFVRGFTGMQLIGNYFAEGQLLHAAHALQQATDWHQQAPAGI